jgi:hypothetical protein
VVAPVHIPAGGVVHMALLEPVVPPGVKVEVPPREYRRPRATFNEPPYKSMFTVPSDPLNQVSP